VGFTYSGDPAASWDSDLFEDQVARTVIALYERAGKVRESDWPGLSESELRSARERGAYVQHPNRPVFDDELDAPLDSLYQGLFLESHGRGGSADPAPNAPVPNGLYASLSLLKRAPSIPAPFYPVSPGTPYCFAGITAWEDGALETEKNYFTVRGKQISVCAIDAYRTKRWNHHHRPPVLNGLSLAEDVVRRVTFTANTISDRMHQWGIFCNESQVKVEMQCYHEEIKSLLYARSLPLTATGRKRPILHLVAAHRRRMREGVEIEIDTFLRGVRKVEMGGAVFEVRAPYQAKKPLATP
jgi:hypothetical protein